MVIKIFINNNGFDQTTNINFIILKEIAEKSNINFFFGKMIGIYYMKHLKKLKKID